ncbi:molybdopterin oxidoreductase family protein [Phycisphaerales bacterium AB-hyl4]|uniref:Molybdopterin oxidoreductase family protein n=1 Tax=Natronomicrosphaera hydrolytica TaxID=3242702 RepID=A0ABV4U7J1_9BACT
MIKLPTTAATLTDRVRSAIRNWHGPLTRELLREPGRFGLGQLPASRTPDATTTMICGYCSTGCGLNIHLKDNKAINLTPTTEYPVNLGMACPKGWEALNVLNADDRATTPLLRDSASNGKLRPTDWHTALTTFTDRFKAIQHKHGPASVAFLSTGQIVSEEMALLGALAKFGMGIVHGDGNTRQCMATAVTAYKQSFGFDAPPYTYADFEQSDVIVLTGANPCIAHPIMWERICRNQRSPRIVVIDPRRTETAVAAEAMAGEHLPLRPKSDLTLFYGLANLLIEADALDHDYIREHTTDFDAFAKHVADYSLDRVANETGLPAQQLRALAELIGSGKRVSFWWTMGVNQSHEGTRVAQAIINLALMTGNLGKPGTGANSITGQCNAMGSRLFSNTTSLLGGHAFTNAEHREKVAMALDIPVDRIPSEDSLAYPEIIEAIDKEQIKGLWVIATNPAHSWIGQRDFKRIIDKLDFLVVQDMYRSAETAQHADLVLPAAAWGEKDGTFINSERRIGLVKKVAEAPGQALADFWIFKLIAQYWGCGEMFAQWESPEHVFQLLKRVTADQPCDITGIADYRMIDECNGIQWPFAKGADLSSERRLFEDGRFYHADSRARFIFERGRPMPEPVNEAYPFVLLTGRGSSSQWHTQTRTSKSSVLRKLYPQRVYVEMHPADVRRLGIEAGEQVSVASRRGALQAIAFVTPTVQRGQVFVPMHDAQTNRLTDPVFDPYSRQPAYKACAVSVRRVAHWERQAIE